MSTPPPVPIGANVPIESMYQLILATHESVTRMETRQEEDRKTMGSQDRRIRSLEQWRLALTGVNLLTVAGVATNLIQAAHH